MTDQTLEARITGRDDFTAPATAASHAADKLRNSFTLTGQAANVMKTAAHLLNATVKGFVFGGLIAGVTLVIDKFVEWTGVSKLLATTLEKVKTESEALASQAAFARESADILSRPLAQKIADAQKELKANEFLRDMNRGLSDEFGGMRSDTIERTLVAPARARLELLQKQQSELEAQARWIERIRGMTEALVVDEEHRAQLAKNAQLSRAAAGFGRPAEYVDPGLAGIAGKVFAKGFPANRGDSLLDEANDQLEEMAMRFEELRRTDPSTGLQAGFQHFTREISAAGRVMESFALDVSHGLANAFSTFFFDIMDRRIRTLKDAFRSIALLAMQVLQQAGAHAAGTSLSGVITAALSSAAPGNAPPPGGGGAPVPTSGGYAISYLPSATRIVNNNVTLVGVIDGHEFLGRHAGMVGEIGAAYVAKQMGTSPMFRSEMG